MYSSRQNSALNRWCVHWSHEVGRELNVIERTKDYAEGGMRRLEFAGISMAGLVATRLNDSTAAATDMVAHIDPLIGASTSRVLGEGKTFPGPTMPFGMVQLGPDRWRQRPSSKEGFAGLGS